MNHLKKSWCRSYQFCLKASIPLLPYRQPHILDSVRNLPTVLTENHVSSVLLITDAGIRSHGLTLSLERQLTHQGIRLEEIA